MTSSQTITAADVAALGQVAPTTPDILWRRLLLAIEEGAPTEVASTLPPTRRALPQEELGEFEPFFRAHQRDIFTYLWRMTGDEQAAYDLAQETFLRAWRRFAQIRAYERPGGWLFRVATHLALNHLRSRTTSLGAAISLDASDIARHSQAPAGASADPSARIADVDTMRRALMALESRQRAALVMREIYGLPCSQVAATLGISTGAAKTLLWRARDELRASYAKEAR